MNNSKTTQTSEALGWQKLRERFPIVRTDSGIVNYLQQAIDDGKLLAMVQQSAEEYHGGDMVAQLTAWTKNLNDKRSRIKNANTLPNRDIELMQLHALEKFVKDEQTKLVATRKPDGTLTADHNHSWTLEQIKALDPADFATASSVYNCMHSRKTRYPEQVAKDETFKSRMAAASDKFTEAKKLVKAQSEAKELTTVVATSKALSSKLTKEEADLLDQLLAKLGK